MLTENHNRDRKNIDRRKFVQVAATGIMGAGLALTGLKNVDAQTDIAQKLLSDIEATPLKEVTVAQIIPDVKSNTPIVGLEDDVGRVLPIWIGQAEAQAIHLGLNGVETPRPMTHDLTRNLLEAAEVTIVQGVITRIQQNTFYGLLVIRNAQKTVAVDCRPSDAIALCLRAKSPMLVSEEVLSTSGVSKEEFASMQSEEFSPRKASRIGPNMRNALAQLSSKQREVFILSHYGILTIEDIAKVLGISEATVKVHHHRATKKVREILAPLQDKR